MYLRSCGTVGGKNTLKSSKQLCPNLVSYDRTFKGPLGQNALTCYMSFLEVLLFGTGKTVSFVPPTLRQYLNQNGVQIDVMDTVRCTFIQRSYYKFRKSSSAMHVQLTTFWPRKVVRSQRPYYP